MTPAGLRRLVGLRHLEELDIRATKADDTTFRELCRISTLKRIHVDYTDVSKDAIKNIRARLPKLEIVERPAAP